MDETADDKPVKINIVARADAVADPRTVMVEILNTHITDGTVRRSRRPVDVARLAIPELNRHRIDHKHSHVRYAVLTG